MSGDRRRNTPQEIAEVALAFAAGKTIQWRTVGGVGHWESHPGVPMFNFYYYQYRVKRLPRVTHVLYRNDQWLRSSANKGLLETTIEKQVAFRARNGLAPDKFDLVTFTEQLS